MQRLNSHVIATGLIAALVAAPAAAGCGLNVNPAALDTNHNAQLSRAETYGTPLAPVFDRIDSNRDGVISQPEYANRCANLQTAGNRGWDSGWDDSVVGKRVERQQSRQQDRVNNRINQETDKATDNLMDKAMGALFGN